MADAVAAMLGGDLPAVVTAALTGGGDALGEFTVKVGRPVGPMLAQTATGVADALEPLGGTAVFEAKLDGARLQIHRDGADVSLYTRSLDDVSSLGVWVSDGSRWIAVSALSNYPAAFFGSRQVLHIRRMSAYDNAAPPATDRRPPSSRPL